MYSYVCMLVTFGLQGCAYCMQEGGLLTSKYDTISFVLFGIGQVDMS